MTIGQVGGMIGVGIAGLAVAGFKFATGQRSEAAFYLVGAVIGLAVLGAVVKWDAIQRAKKAKRDSD